ncbi:hypothetical protein [Chryseobacterium taklimakanense]|uniref:hypothetical protein n=1 Tax=Chryseobacterium taklimakanense TaxID=536441 RepID=UPI0013DDB500|nr:hypothetical protein [Chryseobacterium taklimakanense]
MRDQNILFVLFFLISIQLVPHIYLTVKFFILSKNFSFNFLQQYLEIKNLNFQKLISYKDILKVKLLKSANYDTGYNLSFVTFDNYCTFKIYTKDGVFFLNSFYFSDIDEVMTILEYHKIEVIIKNGLGFF